MATIMNDRMSADGSAKVALLSTLPSPSGPSIIFSQGHVQFRVSIVAGQGTPSPNGYVVMGRVRVSASEQSEPHDDHVDPAPTAPSTARTSPRLNSSHQSAHP